MMAPWLLCFAVLLPACAQNEPKIIERPVVINLPDVPEQFRSCPGLPTRPAADAMQSDAAEYVVLLELALVECHSDLEGLNTYLTTLRAELNI